MAESDFSWFKILSVIGAGLLVFLCFVVIAVGISLIKAGDAFHGVAVVIAGAICGALAWWVYQNYQKKTRAAAPGVKIEDIQKK